MKQKLNYWLDTIAPSLVFIAAFFICFFIYFNWQIGIYAIVALLFVLLLYYVFIKESESVHVVKIDESLHREFESHRALFDLSQEALIFIHDTELIDGNGIFEELTGKPVYTLRGKEWLKQVHEEDLSQFLDWLKAADFARAQNFLHRIYNHSTGELLWLQARKRDVPSLARDKVKVISFKDVSDHKVYQEKALESQIQVYTLIDFAPIGIIIFDEHGKVDYINKFAQELIGYSRLEMVQAGLGVIVHADERADALREWDEFFKKKEDAFFKKIKVLTKSDESLDIIMNCVAVKNLEGNINSYFLTLADLTETQKLVSKNQFYVGILDNTDAIAIVDTEGSILEANKLFLQSLGIEKNTLGQISYFSLFAKFSEYPENLISIAENQVYRDEVQKDILGHVRWFERTFIPYYVNKRLEHFYILHKDITQRVEQEKTITDNNSLLSIISSAQNDFISRSNVESFNNILEKIAFFKKCSDLAIFEIDENSKKSLPIANFGKTQSLAQQSIEQVLLKDFFEGKSNLITNLKSGSPVIVNAEQRETLLDISLDDLNSLQNFLAIPIMRHQKVVGLFILMNCVKDFEKKDIEILLPITSSLSTMIFATKEMNIRNDVEEKNLVLQKKIANQLKQLDEILTSSPDTYILFDAKGKIEFFSNKNMDFLKLPDVFSLGASIYNFEKKHYEYADIFIELFEKAINGENSSRVLNVKGEDVKSYLFNFINVQNNKDEIVSVVCVVKDITEQKNYERELSIARDAAIRASESKTEYLTALYKEIFAPLNSLLSLIQVYENKDLDQDQAYLVSIFKNAAQEIDQLMTQFFNLTTSPLEKVQESRTTDKFEEVIEENFKRYQDILVEKNIKVYLEKKTDSQLALNLDYSGFKNFIHSVFEAIGFYLVDTKVFVRILPDESEKSPWKLQVKILNKEFPDFVLKILDQEVVGKSFNDAFAALNLKRDMLMLNVHSKVMRDNEYFVIDFYFDASKSLSLKHDRNAVESILDEEEFHVGKKEDLEDLYKLTRIKSLAFDHRTDFLQNLNSYLNEMNIDLTTTSQLQDFENYALTNDYAFIFVDFSQQTVDVEKCLARITERKGGKFIGLISPQQKPYFDKSKNIAIDKMLLRPFKRSEIADIVLYSKN